MLHATCAAVYIAVYYKQLSLDWVDWNLTFVQTFCQQIFVTTSVTDWRDLIAKYWAGQRGEKTGKLSNLGADFKKQILS